MDESLSGADLISAVRQLVIGFRPYIHEAGSVEQAEDAILHLEENDENFHRYDFVRQLRTNLDGTLGGLIEDEIERHSIAPYETTEGQESVISKITDRVINSPEFQDLAAKLKANVSNAVEYLVQNFDEEFMKDGQRVLSSSNNRRREDFSDGESSFDESSLNQSSFMFLNTEQFAQVVDNLDKRRPLEVRHLAVQNLAQIPSLDVSNLEIWSQIRQGLQDALSDQDEQLWLMTMKFIARGFSSNSPCTREMYTTIVEFMQSQFNVSNKGNIPKLKDGLDCTKMENIKLVKSFRLVNEFQRQVPQYWIRYPDRFLDEILELTLSLMSIHHSSVVGTSAQMTPVHYLAIADPKAHWFNIWMHGHYCRAPLLKMLERHRGIIENAVRAVLEFMTGRKWSFDLASEASVTLQSGENSEGIRLKYSGVELEFAYFVHSLHFLGYMLCYNTGRAFFPLKIRDRDEPMTVTSLLVTFIHLLTEPVTVCNLRQPSSMFDPCVLVTHMMKKLCSLEGTCKEAMCKDDITNALLEPVSYWLNWPQVNGSSAAPSESTLLLVADILSVIASSASGRRHLLYGEGQEQFSQNRTAPAHLLARFTSKALQGQLPADLGPPPSSAVIGNLLYICRQLYSTCEGLQILYPYDLHTHISQAWKQANVDADRAATPTPSLDGLDSARESQYIILWEDTLRDNLLSFVGTPKGLILLQQTGALNECITYMYSRYARRLQVSKCEKYGYGYMMSQVVAVAPGMVAVCNTDYVKSVLFATWAALEVVDDNPVFAPKLWPTEPLDKSARKPFNNLATLLSSFSAVYEVMHGEVLPTKESYTLRDMPVSILEFLDRLVVVDSEEKLRGLCNCEQSHVFGLRLLSCLLSCLDTLLLLQAQYRILDVLLGFQQENTLEDGKTVILDMLSMECNYLLVKSYLIGGASERILPPRSLDPDKNNMLHFPLFTSYPVPKQYIPNAAKSSIKQENDLSRYLTETKKDSLNTAWLEKCKKLFCGVMTSKPDLAQGHMLQDLLERSAVVLSDNSEEAIFKIKDYIGSPSSIKSFKLNALQKEGVKLAVRYGIQLKLVSSTKEAEEKLTRLLQQIGVYLKQQQRSIQGSQLKCLKGSYPGFDWFVASVFLMMNGNGDRAWKFLHRFSGLAVSGYLWMQRLHASVHLPQPLAESGIPPVFYCMCHQMELILQAELNHVHSAFKMSGFTPAQICLHWVQQCFWQHLDWLEICHYLCVCTLLGVDYQVYMFVAILKHLQTLILEHHQQQDLIVFLKEEPIRGFRVGDYLEYMQQLEEKYRRTILPTLLDLAEP